MAFPREGDGRASDGGEEIGPRCRKVTREDIKRKLGTSVYRAQQRASQPAKVVEGGIVGKGGETRLLCSNGRHPHRPFEKHLSLPLSVSTHPVVPSWERSSSRHRDRMLGGEWEVLTEGEGGGGVTQRGGQGRSRGGGNDASVGTFRPDDRLLRTSTSSLLVVCQACASPSYDDARVRL